jgi:exosortase E/protease (VPEID-CTERM system)
VLRAPGLLLRLSLLGVLWVIELTALSVWLDTASLTRTVGLTGLMGDWGPVAVRAAVAFAVVFVTFGFLRSRTDLERISSDISRIPISRALLAWHLCGLVAFGALSQRLFGTLLTGARADFTTAVWMAAGIGSSALAALAFVPLRAWLDLIRSTGKLWVFSSFAAVASILLGKLASKLWAPTTELTFRLVAGLLHPILPGLILNGAEHEIGTAKFSVIISPQCSGLEGAGLMLVFGILWLWFFRRDCRFPHALLLIPVSILVLWVVNLARIAILILIGNAGAPGVAAGGFHSQAGWIAFNAVALSFAIVARRVSWLSKVDSARVVGPSHVENPAAPYLMPFLVILAASMISRAASSGFEWFYPLRLFGALAALWVYRARYKDLDWRVGMLSVLVGVGVFALWLGLDRLAGAGSNEAMQSGLAALPAGARVAWLVFRTLAGVVTVPIAEELAFRGFLIRRLISADFEALSAKEFTWLSLVGSSLVFGLMHGSRWIAGTVAGLLYAAVFLRRGRIGDAVAAHATTNALLAAWVLVTGDWGLW